MTVRHDAKSSDAGYSMIELALVLTIVGTLCALATPSFLTYYQASRLRVGAEEVAAFVNQGRQLGIRQNVANPGLCVHVTSTALQYQLGSCTATTICDATLVPPCIWVGPGTDASGNIKIPQGLTLTTNANTDPVFNYLGAANSGGTIAVTNTQTSKVIHVTVAVSGRVSVGP